MAVGPSSSEEPAPTEEADRDLSSVGRRVVVEVIALLARAHPAVGGDGPVLAGRLRAVVHQRRNRGDEDLALEGLRVAVGGLASGREKVVNAVRLPVCGRRSASRR